MTPKSFPKNPKPVHAQKSVMTLPRAILADTINPTS